MTKARVQKRLYYKIGEACKALGIQPYVLRYWETEFPALAPSKSRSGQRVYSEKELEVIRRIKELLYDEGYTIAGAKKKLEAELANGGPDEPAEIAAAVPETPEEAAAPAPARRQARPLAAPASPLQEAPGEPAPPVPSLDTDESERIQTLRSGIVQALGEAREILALLGGKSPE